MNHFNKKDGKGVDQAFIKILRSAAVTCGTNSNEKVEKSMAKLDEKLDKMMTPYESAITLLCNIPGVERASAITIISEIGTDMSQFANSKRLC